MEEITPRFESMCDQISRDASIIKQDLEHQIETLTQENHSKDKTIQYLKEQSQQSFVSPNCSFIRPTEEPLISVLENLVNKLNEHGSPIQLKLDRIKQKKGKLMKMYKRAEANLLLKENELKKREKFIANKEAYVRQKEEDLMKGSFRQCNENSIKKTGSPFKRIIQRLSRPLNCSVL